MSFTVSIQSMTLHNINSDQSIMYRGPVLLSISSTYLLLPIIRALQNIITSEILLVWLIMILGLYYTISDYAVVIRDRLKGIQKEIQGIASKIILDSVLRDTVCSLGCFVCSWMGLVGTYTIPFSSEDRVQLLQSILPSHIDARRILFTPGGFWEYLFPEKWRKIVVAYNKSDDNGEGKEEIDRHTIHRERNTLDDLAWDKIDGLEDETDSLTEEGHSMNSPSSAGVERISLRCNQDSLFTSDNANKHPTFKISRMPATQTGITMTPGMEETLRIIFTRLLTKSSQSVCKKINHKQLRSFGVITTISLLVQLKISHTARKIVWKTFNASITFGLIGLIVSSFGTVEVKNQIMGLVQEEMNNSDDHTFQRSRRHFLNLQKHRSNFANENKELVHVRSFVSKVIKSIQNNEKIKQKLQGALTVLLLYYFRKRVTVHYKNTGCTMY